MLLSMILTGYILFSCRHGLANATKGRAYFYLVLFQNQHCLAAYTGQQL